MKYQGEIHRLWRAGGKRILALRNESEITQLELAEQIDAPTLSWLQEVEAGERPISSAYYKNFARSLNLSTDEFARGCLMHYDPKAYEALFGELPVHLVKVA